MKTEMLPKLKCYQNWNITKHNNILKIKIKIQEIGTDHLGLVYVYIGLNVVDCNARQLTRYSVILDCLTE